MSGDRTVFAEFPGGAQVVRYDRAGRWYIEGAVRRRRSVTLKEAVEAAMEIKARGGRIYCNLPGGVQFYAKVSRKTWAP